MAESTQSQTRASRAVSPVIGVILMVAITVILAAVIGTFVLNLGDNQEQNAVAGVDITQNAAQDVTVTAISMDGADKVIVKKDGTTEFNLTSVGGSNTVTGNSGGETITVIAELEGKQNVIQTYTVR